MNSLSCDAFLEKSIRFGLIAYYYYLIFANSVLIALLLILYPFDDFESGDIECVICISLFILPIFAICAAMKFYRSEGANRNMLKLSIGISIFNAVIACASSIFSGDKQTWWDVYTNYPSSLFTPQCFYLFSIGKL